MLGNTSVGRTNKRANLRSDIVTDNAPSGGEESDQVFFGLPGVYLSKGAHAAHFFNGEDERLRVLAPFLQAGLEAGDQCILISEPQASPLIIDHLRDSGIDVDAAIESGQLSVSNGSPDMSGMEKSFEAVISVAKAAGRSVIRIGGDMTWALGKMPSAEKLLEWEAFYDQYVAPRSDFVALCQYDHSRFGGSAVMSALQTHPLSIIGGIVQQNPFYRDPEDVLRELANSERMTPL